MGTEHIKISTAEAVGLVEELNKFIFKPNKMRIELQEFVGDYVFNIDKNVVSMPVWELVNIKLIKQP